MSAGVVLLVLILRHASPALVFRDGLLHRLIGGGVGQRLEWDGDRNSRDQARRQQWKVVNVAAWPKPPRLNLKIKKIIKSLSNSERLRWRESSASVMTA